MPSFWQIKFNHWLYSRLICPAGNPYQEISVQYHTWSQSTNCASSEDRPQWSPLTAGGRWCLYAHCLYAHCLYAHCLYAHWIICYTYRLKYYALLYSSWNICEMLMNNNGAIPENLDVVWNNDVYHCIVYQQNMINGIDQLLTHRFINSLV